MTSWHWKYWWLAAYMAGLFLIPPIHFHGKMIFAAEWMLIPLVCAALVEIFKSFQSGTLNRFVPPRELMYAAVAVLVAFLFGIGRGDTGIQCSIYPLEGDEFHFVRDLVSALRWLFIFMTPWLVFVTFRNEKGQLGFFWRMFKLAALASALMACLDHFNLINLKDWGYHGETADWAGRSYGTFTSPLDASLVYATALVYLGTRGYRHSTEEKIVDAVTAATCLAALAFTHGATAAVVLLGTALIYALIDRTPYANRLFFLMVFVVIAYVASRGSPHEFMAQKKADFFNRFETWIRFLKVLPHKPWIVIGGIGFSGLVVDNSILLLIIKGGIILAASVGLWIKKLYGLIPRSHVFPVIFWTLSWLALDSLGFWGTGRLMWLTLGLAYSENFVTSSDM